MGSMTPRRPFTFLSMKDFEPPEEDNGPRRSLELHRVMRRLRRFTRDIEDVVAERPLTVIGVAAASSFVGGALLGSRVLRVFAAVALGFGIAQRLRRGVRAADDAEQPTATP